MNWLDKLKSVFSKEVKVEDTVDRKERSFRYKEARYLEKIENCKIKIEGLKAILNDEIVKEFVPMNAITDKTKLQNFIDNEERFIQKWNNKLEELRKENI